MQYRKDKYGNDLSALGFGCMRFSRRGPGIDVEKARREVRAAIESGVNYFDTAYIYPGSEAALGEILSEDGLRDRVRIATKLPHYLLRKPEDIRRFFDEQLRRLRTDHVDYYLMHMLTDPATWQRLTELGVADFLREMKASGAIGRVGFSYHGNADTFMELVDAYDWDFCQIQYNYLDEHTQAGVTGLRYAAQKGLPVIIMEPLRGGRLVRNLPREALRLMESREPRRSPAEWAFRWLWDQKEVTCVLSGMNSAEMVEENVRVAAECLPGDLTEEDHALIRKVAELINAGQKVGCTGCRYCMPCPRGVDIPGIFAALNRRASDGAFRGLMDYYMCTAARNKRAGATLCVGCGKCESHCPQGIAIRQELKAAAKTFEGPVFKVGSKILGAVMKY